MSRWKPPRCKSGKAAFRTEGEARRALHRIEVTNAQAVVAGTTQPQRAYRCKCGAWHLTSQR